MKAHGFVHDHYSIDAGESPAGHLAATMFGLGMLGTGILLMLTVAMLPEGIAVGLMGLFVFGAGMFGHIRTPLKLADLMENVVAVAGMAISVTLALAIGAIVVGCAVTLLALILDAIQRVI